MVTALWNRAFVSGLLFVTIIKGAQKYRDDVSSGKRRFWKRFFPNHVEIIEVMAGVSANKNPMEKV